MNDEQKIINIEKELKTLEIFLNRVDQKLDIVLDQQVEKITKIEAKQEKMEENFFEYKKTNDEKINKYHNNINKVLIYGGVILTLINLIPVVLRILG